MKRVGIRLVGVVLVLIAWEIVGRRLGDALFAPPSAVVAQFIPTLRDGSIFATLGWSLQQMLVGFALAYAIGAPLGIWMARSVVVDALIHPWLNMAVVTSVAALVPLLILILGTG